MIRPDNYFDGNFMSSTATSAPADRSDTSGQGGSAGSAPSGGRSTWGMPSTFSRREEWVRANSHLVLAGLTLLVVIGIDMAGVHGGSVGPFYVAPVLVALWSRNVRHAIVFAYAATGFMVLGFMQNALGNQTESEVALRLTGLALVWLAASLSMQRWRRTMKLEREYQEMEQRVLERTAELTKSNSILQKEISDRQAIEESLRQLSTHLMQAQDQERRRIARELHDNSGQSLAAIALNLSRAENLVKPEDAKLGNLISDTAAMAEETSREIRTLSYLLHPPLLEEAGLTAAIDWFAKGFSQRSQIQTTVEIPESFNRLPDDVEMTIFRIVQESLTNISRHSGSPTARISLMQSPVEVVLKVEDDGRGIPPEKIERVHGNVAGLGVGIAGIWERVKQMKGEVEINSNSRGTNLMVVLPLPENEL